MHAATADFVSSTTQPPVRELDDLLGLDADALEGLYRRASVPRLAAVTGDLRGRMLAIPALARSPAAAIPRALARSSRFPWRGKSFWATSEDEGGGINRVIVDRFRLFRFSTFVGPSRAGAFEAVQLDYDKPENPFFIRAIKDEIRELRGGLWLGQAWVALPQKTVLGLYFGLAT